MTPSLDLCARCGHDIAEHGGMGCRHKDVDRELIVTRCECQRFALNWAAVDAARGAGASPTGAERDSAELPGPSEAPAARTRCARCLQPSGASAHHEVDPDYHVFVPEEGGEGTRSTEGSANQGLTEVRGASSAAGYGASGADRSAFPCNESATAGIKPGRVPSAPSYQPSTVSEAIAQAQERARRRPTPDEDEPLEETARRHGLAQE